LVANIQMFNILSLLLNGIPNIGRRRRNVWTNIQALCLYISWVLHIYYNLQLIVLIIGTHLLTHFFLWIIWDFKHAMFWDFEQNTMFAFIQRWFSTAIQCSLWRPIPQIGA
jgi:hypothetical protein